MTSQTKPDKLTYTINVQIKKSTDELLCELFEANYSGFVDIVAKPEKTNKELSVTVTSHKVPLETSAPTDQECCVRYQVIPTKGCRRIKSWL